MKHKIISLLLCLSMLFPLQALLSACKTVDPSSVATSTDTESLTETDGDPAPSLEPFSEALEAELLQKMTGQPVDISPFGYLWQSGVDEQATPESYFIPHRLDRIDNVYRHHLERLGAEDAKSLFYSNQTDMLETFPNAPDDPLLTGLLWVGGLEHYKVELTFPEGQVPDVSQLDVRTYPTMWGWFGWTVDRLMILEKAEGNVLTFAPPAGIMIDHSYNTKVPAQTEMIAVFAPGGTSVPSVRVIGDDLGKWRKMTFAVEWGIGEDMPDWKGQMMTHVSYVTQPELKGDRKAEISVLYSKEAKYGLDSRITFVLDEESGLGATIRLKDLLKGPIFVPEAGLYFCLSTAYRSCDEFLEGLAAKNAHTIREKVLEHDEPLSFDEILNNVRFWQCGNPDFGGFPKSENPKTDMEIHVPDEDLERLFYTAAEQLCGQHLWGTLGLEVFRVAAAMEKIGLSDYTDQIYDYFLSSPGVKPDADYSDAEGSLEWAPSMRNDMAYAHEGSHFSTGGIMYAMMQHYFMTQDDVWLEARVDRLKEAADWIIRMTETYMADEIPNQELRAKLQVYGLMPPCFEGDYALPASDWQWYYHDNAVHQLALSVFAKALESIGDEDASYYAKAAETYGKNLYEAVKREALLSPVRKGSDGLSYSFIPRMAYGGGLLNYGSESNRPQFGGGIIDLFQGALFLSYPGGILDAGDRRMVGTVNAMEEAGMSMFLPSLIEKAAASKNAPDKNDVWYWNTFSNLPKISYNASVYLLEDDIPSFLRFFLNHVAVMAGSNGQLWEHAHPDSFDECTIPDNGTAGWFVETFRSMLIMEEEDTLWITRGVPRSWLKDGNVISVRQAPTAFGNVDYVIESDLSNGKITARIDLPEFCSAETVTIRFRHPDSAKITSAEANGLSVTISDDGETVTLPADGSHIVLTIHY